METGTFLSERDGFDLVVDSSLIWYGVGVGVGRGGMVYVYYDGKMMMERVLK